MISNQPAGPKLNLDLVFPGIQTTLEHSIPVYGDANRVSGFVSALLTAPLHETELGIDVRVLVLTLGASVGYRRTFRTLAFEPNENLSRKHRGQRDLSGDYIDETWALGEVRAKLSLPFNDWLLLHIENKFRFEGRTKRSFDWRHGIVHDGRYFRTEAWLFFKDRGFGSFAPLIQLLRFPLDGRTRTQLNYGFAFVTRPGLLRRDDIFVFQPIFHFGDVFGGVNNSDVYGIHALDLPLTFTLAYRVVLDLDPGPSVP